MGGRDRQHVELVHEGQFPCAIDRASVREFAVQPSARERAPYLGQVALLVCAHVARGDKPRRRLPNTPAKPYVCVGQDMQPFLRRHAREVSDRKALPRRRGARLVPRHADPERHGRDPSKRNLQVPRHESGAVLAHGDKAIDSHDLPPDQRERLFTVRRHETIQEEFLAGEERQQLEALLQELVGLKTRLHAAKERLF